MWKSIRSITIGAALALTASSTLLTGCSGGEGEEKIDSAPVSLSVRFVEGGASGEGAVRSADNRAGFSTLALAPGESNAVEYDDVTRILVDITPTDTNLPFYTNFDLVRINATTWEGNVPLLPRGRELRFSARALDAMGGNAFTGQTLATLTINNESLQIPLAPVQDGATFPMPRLSSIIYPAEIIAGQEEQFAFTLRGNAGAAISYRISAAGSTTPAPAFSPATGTITLTNTVADFMTVFTAPEVSSDTPIDYQVTITANGPLSAVAITTNFRTIIKPRPPGGPIVGGTRPSVLFNPVILSLNANGSAIPGAVQLVASVSDDSAPEDLSYQWSYVPSSGTAAATFADAGQLNPALFEDYTVAHQGTITLAVTDENNGTTTLHYTLVPDQFADAIDHDAVNGMKRIASGDAHTCVLTGQNKVRCWGDNTYGQLGYGNTLDVGATSTLLTFHAGDVALPPGDPVAQMVAGNNHTCALLRSGLVMCWGRNHAGQLGYNRTDNLGDGEPVTSFGFVTLGDLATKIAAGGDHTCAILQSGALRCWGLNASGQLGRGDTANIGDNETVYSAGNVDLGLTAGGTVRDLALGNFHTCALLSNSAVRCWGQNSHGQLGYGHSNNLGDNEPVNALPNVSLTGTVRKLVAGNLWTCALTNAGTLRCWGYGGDGQLGQPFNGGVGQSWGDHANELPSTLPSDINTGAQVTDVTAGESHVCALSSDSKLKCWGTGSSGQLGYGSNSSLNAPAAEGIGLDGVSAYGVSAGISHTCALRSNGTARCWGAGADGRTGRGNTNNSQNATGNVDVRVFE